MEKIISKYSELNKAIKRIVSLDQEDDFPIEFNYNESMECPKYRITIVRLESDTFIDSKGQKWKKVEEDEDE